MPMKVTVGGVERTIKTSGKVAKGTPRSKRPGANSSPTRLKYWASRQLEKRKVKNLMRFNKMTRAEATVFWRTHRRGRVKFALGVSQTAPQAA